MTIYTELLAAGCELDHREGDLYVKATEKAVEIINNYEKRVRITVRAQSFTSQSDNQQWFDLPFQYDPFWENKGLT